MSFVSWVNKTVTPGVVLFGIAPSLAEVLRKWLLPPYLDTHYFSDYQWWRTVSPTPRDRGTSHVDVHPRLHP